MTSQGQSGATLYMVNHGFATGALFLIAGFMIARRRSQQIADYGGVQKVAPVLAGLFLISGLAGLSLPGLSTFVSEFLVLVGTFTKYKAAAVAATVGIILAAIYILWMYQRTMTGPVREERRGTCPTCKARELWAVGPLIALIIALGVYPQAAASTSSTRPCTQTLVQAHSTDPVPPASGAQAAEREQNREPRAASASSPPSAARTIHGAAHRVRSALADAAGVRRGDRRACWSRRSCPRPLRRALHLALTLGGLAAAFVLTIVSSPSAQRVRWRQRGPHRGRGRGRGGPADPVHPGHDPGARVHQRAADRRVSHEVSAFAAQAAAVPGSAEEREGLLAGISHTEVYPLTLFAVGGMLLFPAANDLLTMFVALEVLSLPLYLLCGLARRRRLLSQEAAMKYFLLGAFSSAFFLFGVAMLYGYSGSVSLSAIAAAASLATPAAATLLYAGIALLGVGLLFKIGAVPFQSWKPDVYQGAPTPVTALMASCTVVSAFGALLRVFYVAFGQLTWDWRPAMWVVAILTMLVGSIIAITQTDVKRLLAYSSIAQAGFILTGVVAATAAGLSSSLFYLAAYGFTTIGAFAVVTLVRDPAGEAGAPVHAGPGSASGRRWWPACSPSSCSPSPGSR